MREWEKIFHVNGQERKTGVVLTMANKVDFEGKATKKDTEGCNFREARWWESKRTRSPSPTNTLKKTHTSTCKMTHTEYQLNGDRRI